jgi:hypothetical protein
MKTNRNAIFFFLRFKKKFIFFYFKLIYFLVFSDHLNELKLKIILIHFQIKNILKSNRNHTFK